MTNTRFRFSFAQKTILTIIFTTIIAVIVFAIFALNSRNTINIESEISQMSAEYYEKYYFPDLEKSIHEHSGSPLQNVLSEYTDTGFSRVPLRQIIAHTQSSRATIDYISTHCDVNNTFVHFFPEEPFTSTSYHTSYTYSCNF